MVVKTASEAAGRGAGGFLGGLSNNPGIVVLGALIIGLAFFAGDIRKAFGSFGESFGKIELPDITLPEITFPEITFPDFPDITFPDFPELPDFSSFFDNFFNFFNGGGDLLPPPPGTEPTEGLGDVTTPEGCFVNSQGIIECPTPPTFDVCQTFPELCAPEPEVTPPGCIRTPAGVLICPDTFDVPPPINGGFIGPPPPEDLPFMPPVDLPPGFEGGGPSFEGGTIFETDICNKSIGQIASELGISASAAADMKFQACETSDFDFGTNTGSGFGPGDDPLTDPLVTGGATLESEEQRAACTSCELFGLNCPICQGTL